MTTPDGITHTVPAGITRNRKANCWTVAFRQHWIGTRSFGGADSVASLRRACDELARRKAAALAAGWRPHLESAERQHKALRWGRPGVSFSVSGRRGGFFVARVQRLGRKHGASVRVEASATNQEIVARWRLAIAARDLLQMAVRGEVPGLRTGGWGHGRLPKAVWVAAGMLEYSPAQAKAVVGQVRRAFRERLG